MHIVETVTGYYAYHLSASMEVGKYPTLCASKTMVMPTLLPLASWNYTGHLREKYCAKCSKIAKEHGIALPEPIDSTLTF